MNGVEKRGVVALCLSKALDNGITHAALADGPESIRETNGIARAAIEHSGLWAGLLVPSIAAITLVVVSGHVLRERGYRSAQAVLYWTVAGVWMLAASYNAMLLSAV